MNPTISPCFSVSLAVSHLKETLILKPIKKSLRVRNENEHFCICIISFF